jgi:glycosyltransferase involved in cell wall biosynthesis
VKIGFVVERPTQFEVPFYRYVAAAPGGTLRVLYTAPQAAAPAHDPELGRAIDWGFELLGGYDHAELPAQGRAEWLATEMARERYDLLIVNGYTRKGYLLANRLARRSGTATALRLDSVLEGDPPARRWSKRLLFATVLEPRYDLFLGVGTRTLEYLRYFRIPESRTGLFPYAVDTDEFRRRAELARADRAAWRQRYGVPAAARVVLCLAKLGPREAPWDLLRAHAAGDAAAWLLIAGDGPARVELEALASELGRERTRFLGYVPYPDLPALYAAADLFVHPAREERWGVSVAEAMSCGLAVIASERVGAAADLVKPGRNGYTYRAGDVGALAACIASALAFAPAAVDQCNREVLADWDYAATWRGLLRSAGSLRA